MSPELLRRSRVPQVRGRRWYQPDDFTIKTIRPGSMYTVLGARPDVPNARITFATYAEASAWCAGWIAAKNAR